MNNKNIDRAVLSGGRSALAYGGKQFMIPNCLMAGEWSLHRTLQILSVHPFEKIALHELLVKKEFRNPEAVKLNRMKFF